MKVVFEDWLISGCDVLISLQDMILPEFSILQKPPQAPQLWTARSVTDASQEASSHFHTTASAFS